MAYLLLALLYVSCYIGWFWQSGINTDGYNLFQFITIYCIGRFISLYDVPGKLQKWQWGLGWLLFALFGAGYIYVQQKYCANQIFPPKSSLLSYNNPLLIMSSICLFSLFASMTIHAKIINYIAAGTFGVYIIHENPAIHKFLFEHLENLYISSFGGIIASVLIIYVFSWICDWLVRMILVGPIYSISLKIIAKFRNIE